MKDKTQIVIFYLTSLAVIRILLGYESSIFAGMLMIVALLIIRPEW